MQVRTVEFLQSFARAPVEGSRQQNVLQREPEVAQQQAARAGADQQVLNLNRPRQATQTEGSVVDPEGQHSAERRPRGTARSKPTKELQEEGGPRPGGDGVSGARVDVVI